MALDLPVDLLEEILLRLDDAADLVLASAVCASFRRIFADGRFRRRFRSLHRPPVLGFLGHRKDDQGALDFYPAEPPCRSSPAARAVARVADFSFSFLPEPRKSWEVSDIRDGRVLLSRCSTSVFPFDKFAVYDPLQRQHVQVPSIPNDLAACPPPALYNFFLHFEPFLLPAAAYREKDDGGGDDDLSFQMMCNVLSIKMSDPTQYSFTIFFYSSVTGKWRAVATPSNVGYHDPAAWVYSRRHYARGCFFWVFFDEQGSMLMLDTHDMKLSIVGLPTGSEGQCRIIVEVPDQDRVGLLILGQDTLHLYSKKSCWRHSNGDDVAGNDWRHDTGISSFLGYENWSLCGAAEGYALLQGVPRDEDNKPMPIVRYFTVDINTLLVEQLCELEISILPHFKYENFLSLFAPTTV
ncbi:hypothetical protein U9M48_037416 [Paspalum notatum var. saurae]|uniref:F-box domain-containing protein n=1 Tax=Paspalum notatum var. saurae TaxID=547442 RepID=A0AAQ3X9Z4_PASNO